MVPAVPVAEGLMSTLDGLVFELRVLCFQLGKGEIRLADTQALGTPKPQN